MVTINTILLVDDDEDDRGFVLEVIKIHFPTISCVTADNGRDGMDKLIQSVSPPDVIFLDLNMPLMNGKEFLMEVKKHQKFQAIPVVVLTTSSDELVKKETVKLGARHFITKPDKFYLWETILKGFLINPALEFD